MREKRSFCYTFGVPLSLEGDLFQQIWCYFPNKKDLNLFSQQEGFVSVIIFVTHSKDSDDTNKKDLSGVFVWSVVSVM